MTLNPISIGRATDTDLSGRGLVLFDLNYHGKRADLYVHEGQEVFVAKCGTQVLLVVYPQTVLRLKVGVPNADADQNGGEPKLESDTTDFAVFYENFEKQQIVPWAKYQQAEAKRHAAEKAKLEAAKKPAPVMSNKAKAAVVAPKVVAQAKVQPTVRAQAPVVRKKNWVTLGDPRNPGFGDSAFKDLGLALDSAVKKAQAKPAVNVDDLVVA